MKRRKFFGLLPALPTISLAASSSSASSVPQGFLVEPGQELGRDDLRIFLVNEHGDAADARVTYSLHSVCLWTGASCLVGPEEREPVRAEKGEYYASLLVPPHAAGPYFIRWSITRAGALRSQSIEQYYSVCRPA